MVEKHNKLHQDAIEGLKRFNQKDFFEAHEYFETAWRKTNDPSREFYRALLHLSGGFFRLTQNRPKAAKKFFTHATKWLTPFSDQFGGISIAFLETLLQQLLDGLNHEIQPEILQSQYFKKIQPVKNEDHHENITDRL